MGDGSGKKRKHHDDLASPKKKKKVSTNSTALRPNKIQVASLVRPKASPPVVVTAPGILVSKDAIFSSYSKPATKRRRNGAEDDLLLHSSSHRSLDYTAREDKPKGKEPLSKHYIGLYDPVKGQLELVEARKMTVRGAVRSQQASEESMRPHALNQSVFEMRSNLGKEFGTRKAKKAIDAVTENAISPSKNMGNGSPAKLDAADRALMESIKDVAMSVPTREALQMAVDAAKPVPRGNYDAEDIQDVYAPLEIIGRDILELIQVNDWVQAVKVNDEVQVRSRFVANRINRVGSGPDAVARLRLLRYLLFLIVFYSSTKKGRERGTREIRKKDELKELLQPAAPPVIESIRRKFSDGGVMRKLHIDLLITHCCVFACILDSFETNTWDLKEDLQLEQKQINQYFMEVGARIKKAKVDDSSIYLAQLKLPLQFPKLRVGRR